MRSLRRVGCCGSVDSCDGDILVLGAYGRFEIRVTVGAKMDKGLLGCGIVNDCYDIPVFNDLLV